jgi:hypothetical protein
VSIAAPFRILYIALAFAFGVGLTAASVLGLVDLLGGNSGGSDPAPPFSLSSYLYTPIIALIVLLSATAAMRHLWQALALLCWFLLGGAALDALYVIWLFVRHGIVPETVDDAFAVVWALFPMLGLWLVARAKSGEDRNPDVPPSVSAQERIRLRNTLIGVAAVSYFWRAIVVTFNPGMTFAIAYLRGMTDLHGPEQVMLSGVVGATAAIALLACVVVSSRKTERIMHAALAFTAGFALEGFLDTLDYAFWFGSPRELTSSLQDAVAFVACCAALALSVQGERMSSRVTAA